MLRCLIGAELRARRLSSGRSCGADSIARNGGLAFVFLGTNAVTTYQGHQHLFPQLGFTNRTHLGFDLVPEDVGTDYVSPSRL